MTCVRILALGLAVTTCVTAADWPRFRGPNGTGIATDKNIPVTITPNDIRWTTEIPGKGHSSPIVSKGKIFLQSASDDLSERYLISVDAVTGKILWKKTVPGGNTKTHAKNSPASSTPAADGERVYAVFWDGAGLLLTAFDYAGKQLWKTDLGKFVNEHGAGMSPIVVGDVVLLNNDQGNQQVKGPATMQAFNAATGKMIWKHERDAERACFATPLVHEPADGAVEVYVASTGGVTAYAPKDGKVIRHYKWTFDKGRLRTVASPIIHQGILYAVAGDGGGSRSMLALKTDGKGDVTSSAVVWQKKKGTPYVPGLIAKGDYLFWITDKENVATCVEAKTGREIFAERLGGGGVSASPIMIDGKIYSITEDGVMYVFPAEPKYELLAKYDFKEVVYATPAVADGRLYVRGAKHLFCVAAP